MENVPDPGYLQSEDVPVRRGRTVRTTSVCQMVFGALLLGVEIAGISLATWSDPMNSIGAGIWAGVFFIATGATGISASLRHRTYQKRRSLFVTCMIMNVLSIILAGAMAVFNGFQIFLWFTAGSQGSTFSNADPVEFFGFRGTTLGLYLLELLYCIVGSCTSYTNVTKPSRAYVFANNRPVPQHYSGLYAAPPVYPAYGPYASGAENGSGFYVGPDGTPYEIVPVGHPYSSQYSVTGDSGYNAGYSHSQSVSSSVSSAPEEDEPPPPYTELPEPTEMPAESPKPEDSAVDDLIDL